VNLERVEHIGISVKNLDETLKFYTDIMGVKPGDIEKSELPGVIKSAILRTNGSKIELLQFLDPQDPVAKFSDRQADGIHHFAVNVDNITEALSRLKKDGATLIHEKPMTLPSGRKIACFLPRNSKVMIELMED
jgi:methylmalonyl-CoA/ethylmalonyl-CoA epimerase